MTFANTLKYVFMATSANFGNMFSMAGVSLFLPFLPLLPKQILLTTEQFRTGWFLESVLSAALIVLVIRSRRPFFKSQPGKYLLLATLLGAGVTLVFPFTPLGKIFGFQPLPVSILLVLGGIVGLYILTAEVTKGIFYKSGLGR
jgi:Mg2+-importing ATPase